MRPWKCMLDALRSFSWRGYLPLLPILGVQWLFLFLGLNLGQVWGMATAGTIAGWIVGPATFQYPAFLEVLPLTFSYVETVTFVLGGAFALPMIVSAVWSTCAGGAGGGEERAARLRGAYAPTLIALAASLAAAVAWQFFVVRYLPRSLAFIIGSPVQVTAMTWCLSVLVGYAITTLVIYVPVAAIEERRGLGGALREGLTLGRRYFLKTYFLVLLLSLPALIFQVVVQMGGTLLALRTRPENAAYILFAYAALSSLATYFVWDMATRIHHAAGGKRP